MGKVFANKRFSNYLGENRAILDIVIANVPDGPLPSPTPSPTIALSPTPTLTISPTATLTLTPTPSFTQTQTPTFTATQTETPTQTPTQTETPTLTPTLTQTPTLTPVLFDPDYQAILNYATTNGYTQPTLTDKILQNQFLIDLKSCGVWSKMDVLYVFKAGSTTSDSLKDFSKINWKTPSNFYITENGTYSSFYQEDLGWRGLNGTAPSEFYLETGFNPTLHASGYTLDDASLSVYLTQETDQSSAQWLGGLTNAAGISFRKSSVVNLLNSTNFLPSPTLITSGIGLKTLSRSGSTDVYIYSGDQINIKSQTTTAIPNEQILILKQGFGEGQDYLGYVSIGGYLDPTEQTCLNNIIETYMDNVGPVPTNTPTATQTRTPTQTRTETPTQTPTQTETPTPTPTPAGGTFYILAETGDILTAQNGDSIEYEH